MADLATRRRLARRARWKRWSLPLIAAAAAFTATAVFDYRPVAAFFNLIQNVLLATIGASDAKLIEGYPALQQILDWTAAPVVWLVLTLGFVSIPPIRHLLDRILPDPPAFVFSDLDGQRHRSMILIDRSASDFIGRRAELETLRALINSRTSQHSFRWRALLGPSGIGKTRLAIEWLAVAEADGWDVGIVDPEDYSKLADWKPRRSTALVIDEGRSRWDRRLATAILTLGGSASSRRPVRLLVLDQIMPYLILPDASEQDRLDTTQILPPLIVGRMEEEEIRILAAHHAAPAANIDRIAKESAGRPRAAIILAKVPNASGYSDALQRWANLLVPELTDDTMAPALGLSVPLIFAALIGPVPADVVRQQVHDFEPGPLLRFFECVPPTNLERELPELLPDDLAQELALRLLHKLDVPRRDAVIAAVLDQAPARVEARLGAIWRDFDRADDNSGRAYSLHGLQAAFDKAYPDRVRATIEQLDELLREVCEATSLVDLDSALARFIAISSSRPFDPLVRFREASCALDATRAYCLAQRWDDLERWEARLIALAEDDGFEADPAIRLLEAKCAVNLISAYGKLQRWDDLERWRKRLDAIVTDERFAADPAIRLEETRSAVNAIYAYGESRRWDDVERWGERLVKLGKDPRFSDDTAIRMGEAMGAINATKDYGQSQRWSDLERWGNRAIVLAEDEPFASDPAMRLAEAKSTVNAMNGYGAAKRWEDLERWGNRLVMLAEDQRFAADPAIRLEEAGGAFNAVTVYGYAERWDDTERWGSRLIALAEDDRFAANAAIRLEEAMGAVNALDAYCYARRWADVERWGERLISLAEDVRFATDPSIRRQEAMAAVNVIDAYGAAKRWEDLERWGKRLVMLAEDERFAADPAIRREEAMGARNAIIRYDEAGLDGSGPEFAWRRRMAFVAQAFPVDPQIQEKAKHFDLTWLSQQRCNFAPYGRSGKPSILERSSLGIIAQT